MDEAGLVDFRTKGSSTTELRSDVRPRLARMLRGRAANSLTVRADTRPFLELQGRNAVLDGVATSGHGENQTPIPSGSLLKT